VQKTNGQSAFDGCQLTIEGQRSMKDKIINFFTDVVKEMNKVTWPKKDDLRDSTVIVLIVCLLIAGFVYVVDTAVSVLLQQIL
jgi:preprotein translocase subunit SecE